MHAYGLNIDQSDAKQIISCLVTINVPYLILYSVPANNMPFWCEYRYRWKFWLHTFPYVVAV